MQDAKNVINHRYRFNLFSFFSNFYFELKNALSAPFFYFWGHVAWFANVAALLSEIVDIVLLFFLFLFMIKLLTMARDAYFQPHSNFLFKNYLPLFNTNELLISFKFVYKLVVSSLNSLISVTLNYFKTKK